MSNKAFIIHWWHDYTDAKSKRFDKVSEINELKKVKVPGYKVTMSKSITFLHACKQLVIF